jgi:hypothetical protein
LKDKLESQIQFLQSIHRPEVQAAVSLKHPEQMTNVLQPIGEHPSNDLESRPQPHFAMPLLFQPGTHI